MQKCFSSTLTLIHFLLHELGPVQMSRVIGLAQLPGQMLWSVHAGIFSPVDNDEI